jgi:uncharacterized membrane protein
VVTLELQANEQLLIAQPNRSANWHTNKWLIAIMGVWCSLIALFFIALGLWPIVPFMGLEIIALAAGLYVVCWKLEQRHVLRFRADTLVIEKGFYRPRFSSQYPRASIFISVEVQSQAWDPLKIFLCNRSEQIAIGNFLNQDESNELLRQLRAQGLAIRNFSESVRTPV